MRSLVVVSGGDAPGINAAIGQYTLLAAENGDTVLGAEGGFPGLLSQALVSLTFDRLMPWMGRGGSILPSSREPVLSKTEAHSQIEAIFDQHQIDNLILFGGNGTLTHIPPLLREWGIPCIGLPTTIDNDVTGTERSLGFDSACNYAYHTIDGVMVTAHALRGRIFMVETLGGNCGNLALAIAHGAAANAVILPEYEYRDEWLKERLLAAIEHYGYALLVICEGSRGARTLADELPKLTGVRMRDVRLGHAQRGGVPSHQDRVLAAQMAHVAYQALKSGVESAAIVVQGGEVRVHEGSLPAQTALPDRKLYNLINGL